jgi:hypothetical protein
MRLLLRNLRVPLAVAVNRCDDPAEAKQLARQLGALSRDVVVPCQLIDEGSARDVVIAALEAALDRLERTDATAWRPPLERVVESLFHPSSEAA